MRVKKKILVVSPVPREGLNDLEADYELIYPQGDVAFSHEDLFHKIVDCDGLLSVFNVPVTEALIRAGKRLKIIANYGVGYNNIDLDAAKAANIVVTNTPDPVTTPTAELTLGLIVSLLRKITDFDRQLRDNSYRHWDMLYNMGTTLQGKTLGIVGFGAIGQQVARMAQAFGLKVVYYKRNKLDQDKEQQLGVAYKTLSDLIAESDIVSLHTPLTPDTKYLIGEEELLRMKPTAFLINTARGAVVNELALLKALQDGEIAGAALDVFEDEPHITDGLLDLPNVIAVPHIGTQTSEARIEMSRQAAANILSFFSGEEPENRIG